MVVVLTSEVGRYETVLRERSLGLLEIGGSNTREEQLTLGRAGGPFTIVYADEDPNSRALARELWTRHRLTNPLDCVDRGEDLVDYLCRRGRYSARPQSRLPGLILLDLDLPNENTRETLREIRSDSRFCHIPIIAVIKPRSPRIEAAIALGLNSFIVKPITFSSLVGFAMAAGEYSFEIVEGASAELIKSGPNCAE